MRVQRKILENFSKFLKIDITSSLFRTCIKMRLPGVLNTGFCMSSGTNWVNFLPKKWIQTFIWTLSKKIHPLLSKLLFTCPQEQLGQKISHKLSKFYNFSRILVQNFRAGLVKSNFCCQRNISQAVVSHKE